MSCSKEDFREVVSDLNESLHSKMPDNTSEVIFFCFWENNETCGIKLTVDRKFRTTIPVALNLPSYDSQEEIKEKCYGKLQEFRELLESINDAIQESSEDQKTDEWFDL